MPLPIISEVYRVAIQWHDPTAGETATNVIHLRSNVITHNATDVANRVDSAMTTGMIIGCSDSAAIFEYDVVPLDGSSTGVTKTPTGVTHSGNGGEYIPAASLVVTLRTAKRGRSYRGRIYLPFLLEGVQSAGKLASSTVSTTLAAWQTFLTVIETDYNLVVASYKHATAENVTAITVNPAYGTQRRRQERVRFP